MSARAFVLRATVIVCAFVSLLVFSSGASAATPTVTTGAASTVEGTKATVVGTVNPKGEPVTECTAVYSKSSSFIDSQRQPCTESPASIGAGTSPVEVHATLAGLQGGTTYYYEVEAANASGTGFGTLQNLTTLGPGISEETVTHVAEKETDISAQINAHFASTTFHVEYGVGEEYGHSTPESEPIGSDDASHAVIVHLSGLAPGATYHFRFVATNSAGVTDGEDVVFHTYPPTVVGRGCSNESRREEQDAAYLPDCRAYEMVSPLDKNGSSVTVLSTTTLSSTDGERVMYSALAGFAEPEGSGGVGATQYLASRDAGSGWSTHAITPTPAPEAYQFTIGATQMLGFSSDLSASLVEGYNLPGALGEGANTVNLYWEDTATHSLKTVTMKPASAPSPFPFGFLGVARGYSADLKVATFESNANLVPSATGAAVKLYAFNGGEVTLVGVLPDGTSPEGGSGSPGTPNGFGAISVMSNIGTVSADGSRIPFVAPVNGPHPPQLYVRRDGTNTVWVSESEASVPNPEPQGVSFQAISPDGSKILFLSSDSLLDSDPGGAGSGLYLYTDSPNPRTENNLTFIARINPESHFGRSYAVAGMSDDAKRIYFFTEREVDKAPAARGIYLWEEGTVHFVGATSNVPSAEYPESSETSSDGSVIAFLSRGQVNSEVPRFNTSEEMFVYDANTGKLRCASCDPTGLPPSGSASVTPRLTSAAQGLTMAVKPRFLSSDGRRVFFSTPEPLVAGDVNGLEDVYEYEPQSERVSLLSPGTGQAAWFTSASSSGNDVFIGTFERLVGSDTDNLADLYDVRVGGGFPQPLPQTGGCVGDECQGTPQAGPSFNTASGFVGLGNVLGGEGKKTVKSRSLSRAQKLAQALKECKHKRRAARRRCQARTRRRYGPVGKGHTSTSTAGRR